MKIKNLKLFFLILIFFFFSFQFTLAQLNISVFPEVIYDKAKPRDVLEYKIKIKNSGNILFHFYTLVEDLKEKISDKSTSLAEWIEIFRGRTEILPGQEKEIPLTIKVPSSAKAGNYFAQIIFAQGSTELDARERAKQFNMPKVLVNITVEENLVEKLQVKKFQTEKNFYFGPNIKFKIELENIGNKETEETGRILIYDNKGKEVGILELETQKIQPGERKSFEIPWKAEKSGQYKAVLFGEYGKNREKFFQDTTFFWVVSWQLLTLGLILVLTLTVPMVWFLIRNLKRGYSLILKQRKVLDIFKK